MGVTPFPVETPWRRFGAAADRETQHENASVSFRSRLDSTNLLNHPTFTRWDATLGSVMFGRAVAANAMRSVKLGMEVRF